MSRRFCSALLAVLWISPALQAQTMTQDELVRRTQQIFDAIVPGDKAPFQQYFADDVLFHDEKGRSMNKTQLLEDIAPMPKGYSGSIKVVNPQSIVHGNTAILSYDCDETETIYGQELHARYHETDTWLFRNNQWQIAAAQVMRYYEDPASGVANPKLFADFAGTYELAPGVQLTVTTDGTSLYSQRTGRAKLQLIPEAADIFFVKGVEGRRLLRRNTNGTVDALIDRRNNEDVIWKKVK
ncbi:MAG TPA: DUF4440 domain-containing protein [Terriglobales bacterium]|nr:DUF4440 domain-containing protein [Terriglobales bacterium]